MSPHPQKLMDRVRAVIRTKHYSIRTEETYIAWIKRFIVFHDKRHPLTLGKDHIEAFLSHLALESNVSASTQNQAFSAILFLYRDVLHRELDLPIQAVRAKRSRRLPVVLTHEEALHILSCMQGTYQLMAQLLYGSGLRLMECVRLRVKDLNFEEQHIVVRDGKGQKDRITLLPATLIARLQEHLQHVHHIFLNDCAAGYGSVYLPYALERKYPSAGKEWAWQYVFPAERLSHDPRSGIVRRHHISESGLQKAVREAVRQAGIAQPVSCHTFRHSFATQLLRCGYDIRTVQELLGHNDLKTTMIYTHVLNRGGMVVRSPLDG